MTRRALLGISAAAGASAAAGLATVPLGVLRTAAAATEASSLAPLLGAEHWLGRRPDAASLRGKVVLVDVFTFGCINCKHVIPSLRAFHARGESGLVLLGIHTPETPFERELPHVQAAFAAQGIVWPVAIDNDSALWRAYGIEYWPTQLIFDRNGRLRSTVVGEGEDRSVASTIAALLAER
jgi:thiol-disulfide isomerase/thioredoxin